MHPILFKAGSFELGGYTFMAALGGMVFFALLKVHQKRLGITRAEDYWLFVNILLVSAFLGARIFYILLEAPPGSPAFGAAVFAVNRGFSAFGFFAGVLAGSYFFSRHAKLGFLRVFDYICAFLPLWQAVAKVGCFMRGCCYGRPAGEGLPWPVTFTDPGAAVPREMLGFPLHPVQLYEAAGTLVLAAFLYAVLLKTEAGRLKRGAVCAAYLSGYGVLRFALEWFRGDTRFLGYLTVGQALSLVLAAAGLGFLLAGRKTEPEK